MLRRWLASASALPFFLPHVTGETNIAIAVIRAAQGYEQPVGGYVLFSQDAADEFGDMTVEYDLSNLEPGERGFHIHQYGDTRTTANLSTLAAHFVPLCSPEDSIFNSTLPSGEPACSTDQEHGSPPSLKRHIGDMGNILVDENGRASGSMVLSKAKMSLTHPVRSIVGRTVVVHERRDKGSRNEFGVPLAYGDAGNPQAYGVVGIAQPTVSSQDNFAVAPDVPKTSKVICNFQQAFPEHTDHGVRGMALLSLLADRQSTARMQAKLYGFEAELRNARLSFHFHEWGDMRGSYDDLGGEFEGLGIALGTIKVNDKAEAMYDTEFNTSSVLAFAGRSLTVHQGESVDSPTLAAAICGLAYPTAHLETNMPTEEDEAIPAWAIAVIVVACVIVLGVAVVGVLYWLRLPIPLCGRCFYPNGRQYSSKLPPPPPRPTIPLEPARPAGAPPRPPPGGPPQPSPYDDMKSYM